MSNQPSHSGYAPVNGLQLYYESHGAGEPLVLLHGGFGSTGMFGELLTELAKGRRVIAVDLQGHGRTADIDRPLRLTNMGDDVAALIAHLGLERADVMGYSMGGGAALRTAIQHPERVRRLVVVSIPFRRDGWYPEVRAGMDQISEASAEFMRPSPMYQSYAAIAPRPEDFPRLCGKMGELVREDYDWSAEVAALRVPTLLVVGDADGMPPAHAAEFFGLLGGGKEDPGWMREKMPTSRLAILPNTTHYDALESPLLLPAVTAFLDAPSLGASFEHTAPVIEERAARPTAGIRTQVTMAELSAAIPSLTGDVCGWLAQRGVQAFGPSFVRYHVIDMAGKLDVEIGVLLERPVEGDARVQAGEIPAGRYAALVYTGVMNGVAGNAALLEWGDAQGLTWDRFESPHGDGFGSRVETLMTDPDEQPDASAWKTEVAIRIAG